MKIMIEASVYSKFSDIVIAIDGDGPYLHVGVSRVKDSTCDTYYLDGICVDTDRMGKEDK